MAKDKVLGALIQACVIYTPRAGASYKSMVQRVREYWPWEHATNGIIFEFKELEQAKAFAAAVKEKWALDCRVFDDVEEAELAHLYPFGQGRRLSTLIGRTGFWTITHLKRSRNRRGQRKKKSKRWPRRRLVEVLGDVSDDHET